MNYGYGVEMPDHGAHTQLHPLNSNDKNAW